MDFDTEDVTPPELEEATGVSILPGKPTVGAPSFSRDPNMTRPPIPVDLRRIDHVSPTCEKDHGGGR
jgi:hypothetical protein